MNKRQVRKYLRAILSNYDVVKPIPHGFWKRLKENDKRFGYHGSPLPRWRTRLRWIIKQDMAEIRKLFS